MEQKQNTQVEEGISLLDIFKLLLSKIKLLILVCIIGGLIGGGLAIWRTIDIDYWGTTVRFHISPEYTEGTTEESASGSSSTISQNIMEELVGLLEDDEFSETMILSGKPLPEKDVWVDPTNKKEVELQLNEKIDVADVEVQKLRAEENLLAGAISARNEKNAMLTEANTALNDEWKKLYYAGTVESANFNELEYYKKVQGNHAALDSAYQARETAQNAVDTASENVTAAKASMQAAKEIADEKVELALEAWRKTWLYKETMEDYQDALSFSYLKSADDFDDANKLAKSFIYVKISTLNEQEFAEELLEKVKVLVSPYIAAELTNKMQQNMTCKRISRLDDVRLTNPGYTTKKAITFALLAGVAAVFLAAIVVVLLDKSDKRLRDTEIITKKFNVPLLGVVPTIEELKSELDGKKRKEKSGEKEAE